MNRDDVQKLLGGYATGTLTPEEQQALFDAALEDQELFDRLAREQALRDLLRDPAAKAHLLAALDRAPARWPQRLGTWLRQPVFVVAATAGMAAAIAVVVVRQKEPPPAAVTVAEVRAPKDVVAPPAPEAQQAPPAAVDKATDKRSAAPAMHARQTAAPLRRDAADQLAPTVAVPAEKPAEKKEQLAAAAPPPPPSPAAPPASRDGQQGADSGASAGQVAVGASAPALMLAEAKDAMEPLNARALFYNSPAEALQFAPAARFANGIAGPAQEQQKAGTRRLEASANSVSSSAKSKQVASLAHLGVRCVLLRGPGSGAQSEADLRLVLDSGEAVRLRLASNDAGVLYVMENRPGDGWRMLARAAVERQKPFDTPVLKSDQPGPREFYVLFGRFDPGYVPPAVPSVNPRSVVRTTADPPERATYVVTRDPAAQQVGFTITLNWK